jgi:hypothetical protein
MPEKNTPRAHRSDEGEAQPVFHSALSIMKMAEASNSAAATRAKLEAELRANNIDVTLALSNLPQGAEDTEAVARLVSLARGHGYIVQLGGDMSQSAEGLELSIVMPARGGGGLQSGHDH